MEPYLSFVVAARNDNYGGYFLHRMQIFINGLMALREKHDLPAELIVVEWNPPVGNRRLIDALSWPRRASPGTISLVEVSGELHRQLPNSDRMPMFEYIAKNVGIRHARGKFVLATNPDILFSDELMKFFANKQFSAACFYRVDRCDVAKIIPLTLPVSEQLEFCRKYAYCIHQQSGSRPTSPMARLGLYLKHNTGRLTPARVLRGIARRAKALSGQSDLPSASTALLPPVHANAAGDFILMAKAQWHRLRGFPELKTHSHIDSFMCHLASIAGVQQIISPHPIYHQEHERAEAAARPLTILQDLDVFEKWRQTGQLENVNDESWGLANACLPITQI
ncbi:MAG: hypothetical protein HYR55_00450 [Acidobacteria bacterium]|nr:hypothetical protein [Acidobacteriota bacterium]MBI3655116.1 hypothetical protein [Acidobacteriota bacterium]